MNVDAPGNSIILTHKRFYFEANGLLREFLTWRKFLNGGGERGTNEINSRPFV
jgi:hypothetical protein